jgi:hypothetical protein
VNFTPVSYATGQKPRNSSHLSVFKEQIMMISLLNVEYLGNGQFTVDFSDGLHGTFDPSIYLSSRQGPLLLALKDESYIKRAFIEAGALAWPNGLEISPHRIYGLIQPIKCAA